MISACGRLRVESHKLETEKTAFAESLRDQMNLLEARRFILQGQEVLVQSAVSTDGLDMDLLFTALDKASCAHG